MSIPFERRPYAFFFRGQVDGRAAYHSRFVACEALAHVPGPHVCVASSVDSKSLFQRACVNDVFASLDWARSQVKDGLTTPSISDFHSEAAIKLMAKSPHEVVQAEEKAVYFSQERCKGPAIAYDYFLQLAYSRFCLMIRGDTLTSNRLFDCLRYGLIPVIISDNILAMGLPFTSRVPWHEFSFFVKEVRDPKDMVEPLVEIARTSSTVLGRMQERMTYYFRDTVWNTEASRAFENSLLEAYDRCIGNGELNRTDVQRAGL
jgi:hypothetical protein